MFQMSRTVTIELVPERCGHCGGWHDSTCPLVKSLEYYPDGTIKRVEYHDRHFRPVNVPQDNLPRSPMRSIPFVLVLLLAGSAEAQVYYASPQPMQISYAYSAGCNGGGVSYYASAGCYGAPNGCNGGMAYSYQPPMQYAYAAPQVYSAPQPVMTWAPATTTYYAAPTYAAAPAVSYYASAPASYPAFAGPRVRAAYNAGVNHGAGYAPAFGGRGLVCGPGG